MSLSNSYKQFLEQSHRFGRNSSCSYESLELLQAIPGAFRSLIDSFEEFYKQFLEAFRSCSYESLELLQAIPGAFRSLIDSFEEF